MSDGLWRKSRAWRSVACAAALVLCVPRGAHAQLGEILDIVQNIQSRVTTAISQAQAARVAAEEIRTQVRTGTSYLTPQLQQFIDDAIDEGRTILEEESAGMDTFAPGGQCAEVCEAFRANLVEFLAQSVDLTDAVLESTGAPVNPDLSQLVTLAQLAPPRLLYPMYRMFQEVLASDLTDRVRGIIPETRFVIPLVMQTAQDPCGPIVQHAERIQRWTTGATAVGVVVQVIGGVFKVIGETEFAGEVGVAGFVSGTIKQNRRKQVGEFFNVLATIIDKASTFGTTKVRYCLIFAFQDETSAALAAMQATLSGLNLDLANLDQPVSSRATQASVDEVHSTLQGVARDVTLLLDQHGGNPGDPGGSLTLRVQVERQMRSGEGPLSVFYLPETFGGLLEIVREIVEDTLVQHQAAGYPVGQAWHFLSKGDQARTEFDYRSAYGWYQHAYRMATIDKPRKDGR